MRQKKMQKMQTHTTLN